MWGPQTDAFGLWLWCAARLAERLGVGTRGTVQDQRIFWKVKCPSLQDTMKDAALFKLSLFLTEHSQSWDQKNATATNMTTDTHCDNHTVQKPSWWLTRVMSREPDSKACQAGRAQNPSPATVCVTLDKPLNPSPSCNLRKPQYPPLRPLHN